MSSTKEYLNYILEQLTGTNEITYKAMMGEYIIYHKGKIIGGIYDNRFLVKKVGASLRLMPDAVSAMPYDGAKEMLLVDEVDDKDFLRNLVCEMYDELPAPRKK